MVPKFSGLPKVDLFEEVLILETFCGTAGLSQAVQDFGLSILAIDHECKAPIHVTRMDLTSPEQQKVFLECVCFSKIGAGHFAPPCGTASRAREKPLPKQLAHLDVRPLRSDQDLLQRCEGVV